MATLIIHGTMTLLGPSHATWWWDSRHDFGFLDALAGGLADAGGVDDIWRVGKRSVTQITQLGERGLRTRDGYFEWGGVDAPDMRRLGGEMLVDYLNRIVEIAPREPIRLVAHSHGCNVVKEASAHPGLDPRLHFARAAFLACPHLASRSPAPIVYHHRLAPQRFEKILNLSSETDSVQVGIAETFLGPFGSNLMDYNPPYGHRVDPDPLTTRLYENATVATLDEGSAAHTAMHGQRVGYLVGRWLAGESIAPILRALSSKLLPVPHGDFGA